MARPKKYGRIKRISCFLPNYISDIIDEYSDQQKKNRSEIFTDLLSHGINFVENFNGGEVGGFVSARGTGKRQCCFTTDSAFMDIAREYGGSSITSIITTLLVHGINFTENFE
jgi:metal-responsive CopG/Arc/MetJ family transcriptional regulator